MGKKGELVTSNLVPWIVTLGIIILLFVLYGILFDKSNAALEWLKQIWRFGG